MQEIANSEIFFIISTFFLVLFGVMMTILLAYAIRMIHSIHKIMNAVGRELEAIVDDVEVLRASIKDKAGTVSGILGVVMSLPWVIRKLKRNKEED